MEAQDLLPHQPMAIKAMTLTVRLTAAQLCKVRPPRPPMAGQLLGASGEGAMGQAWGLPPMPLQELWPHSDHR